jgi:hypothetical protein
MIRKILGNEKGIALMMVLVISAIAISIMSALMFMLTTGTQVSGMKKRYTTALEAASGGQEAAFRAIGKRQDPGFVNSLSFNYDTSGCMNAKLFNSTIEDASITESGWGGCDSAIAIVPGDSSTYDMSVGLGDYMTYVKIVNTVRGNSSMDMGLVQTGVVTSNPGEIQGPPVPYVYAIEVDSRNQFNQDEKAKLSILYQY